MTNIKSCRNCDHVQIVGIGHYCTLYPSDFHGYPRIDNEDVDNENRPIYCKKKYFKERNK